MLSDVYSNRLLMTVTRWDGGVTREKNPGACSWEPGGASLECRSLVLRSNGARSFLLSWFKSRSAWMYGVLSWSFLDFIGNYCILISDARGRRKSVVV